MATSQNIEDMKLPELKELAKQMGLRGTSTMRKPQLLATLQAARSGGNPPEGVTVRTVKKSGQGAGAAANLSASQVSAPSAAQGAEVSEAMPQRDQTAAAREQKTLRAAVFGDGRGEGESRRSEEHDDDSNHEGIRRVIRRTAAHTRNVQRQVPEEGGANLLDELDIKLPEANRGDESRGRKRDELDADQTRRRRRSAGANTDRESPAVRDLDDILAVLPEQDHGADVQESARSQDHEPVRRTHVRDHNDRNNDRNRKGDRNNDRSNGSDRRQRHIRGREREFDNTREEQRDEHRDNRREEVPDDVVPVAGIVDVLDSYAFVRTSGYLPGPNDVYVSMGQVKKYGLRKGDAVHGSIRTPREGDRRNQRQKFVPLQSIDTINGMGIEESVSRPHFSKLTPLYPQERLKQEVAPNRLTGRLIDIVAPIGKGQRGLIVSPPKAGKTITLQNIANSIATNNPEVHLMVVLVDERPEEVTDMERTVQGEVISSTFDRPASDHTTVAELAIERAKRLVELGQDVVVLLDSMTRLARAYNISAPASGRILSGGVDAQALYPPKKFFGAARNIENGGSLTIISSALVETGSKMDEVIFEEFKGTGNMELRLSRELADKRLFPAIDINASGTRREELITASDELPIIYRLRRLLGGLEPEQAYQTLVPRLKKTATNRDFLTAIIQQSGLN
ncbi:MAG: transcription termination factor Rho [Bifidobacterium sp.]|nr:transcription termination factor Rho [Bifidobacterium sp.]